MVARPSVWTRRLAELDGGVDLTHLHEASVALEAVAKDLPREAWETQSVAFSLGECLAHLEAAVAVAELGDPRRRRALGARDAEAPVIGPLDELSRFTIAAVCGRVLSEVARIAHGAGVKVSWDASTLALAQLESTSGRILRAAVRDA